MTFQKLRNQFLFVLIPFLFLIPKLSIAQLINITASNVTANIGDNISVDIVVQNMSQITALSFTLDWNSSALQYQSISSYGLPGMNTSTFNTTLIQYGQLGFNWNGTSTSYPPSVVIFKLNFKVRGFSNYPVPLVFSDNKVKKNGFVWASNVIDGMVTIICNSKAAGKSCQTAPLLCGKEMNPYCGSLGSPNNTTDPGKTLSCGEIQNNQWIAFTAGSSDIDISIFPSMSGAEGLQATAFSSTDCNTFVSVSNCLFQVKDTQEGKLQLRNLTIGTKYYLMVDGYNSDTCDYYLKVTGGVVDGNAMNPPDSIVGPSAVCINQTNLQYSVLQVPGATKYVWSATNGASITSSNNNQAILKWGSTTAQVCVVAINKCDTTIKVCKTVTTQSKISIKKTVTLCKNTCYNVNNTNYCNPGVFNITITNSSGCDTSLELTIVKIPDANLLIDTVLCKGSCLSAGGQNFCVDESKIITLNNAAFNGCDSNITIKVKVIDITAAATSSGFLSCTNKEVTLSGTNSVTNSILDSVVYIWYNSFGIEVDRGVDIKVTNSGIYTLNMVGYLGGQSCISTTKVNVNKTSDLPNKPTFTGTTQLCKSTIASYNITSSVNGISSFDWDVFGGKIITGVGKDSITVLWDSIGIRQICVVATNSCGSSPSNCISVDISDVPAKPIIIGNKTTCSNINGTFSVNSNSNITNFVWLVPPGASIISGQNTNAISVNWGTANTGNVCITTMNKCGTSTQTCDNIIINKLPIAPSAINGAVIMCQNEKNSYNISAISGVTGYNWSVTNGNVITKGQNTNIIEINWTKSGNAQICVEVTNPCGVSSKKCIDVSVNSKAPVQFNLPTAICSNQLDLDVTPISNGTWTYTKQGNGTLNFANNTNAKTKATVTEYGMYKITWTVNNGSCSDSASANIEFNEKPSITVLTDNCDVSNSNYILIGKVSGGVKPYMSIGADILTINNNDFTSVNIPSGNTYQLIVKDTKNCISNTINDRKSCQCGTSKGIIDTTPIVLCFGNLANVQLMKRAVLDQNDIDEFILHDKPDYKVSTILGFNNDGRFTYTPNLNFNQTYYITYIAGNKLNARVDLNDNCLAISSSLPIVFKPKIEASFSKDTMICRGSPVDIKFNTTLNGIYNLVYKVGNVTNTIANINSNALFSETLYEDAKIEIVSAIQIGNGGCKALIINGINVKVRKVNPDAGANKVICGNQSDVDAKKEINTDGSWKALNPSIKFDDVIAVNSKVTGLIPGYNYLVWTVKDSVCPSTLLQSDTMYIYVHENPKANNDSYIIKADQILQENILKNDILPGPVSWKIENLQNPTFGVLTIPTTGGIIKYVPGINDKGIVSFNYRVCSESCIDSCSTGQVRIKVNEVPISNILSIPNAITPNGDGKNETLVIENIDKFPNNELIIFNRWGNIVFKSKPYHNEWDGANLPDGTYYYILNINQEVGDVLKGDVTIIR